ncbi:hypothetical protein V2J09_018382 [Rumex salicifolius]
MGGFLVTFSTTAHYGRFINATGISPGHLSPIGTGFLRFDFFDDACADVDPLRWNRNNLYLSHLERVGPKRVSEMLRGFADEGRPVSCIINGTLVPWAWDVAEELGIPMATITRTHMREPWLRDFGNLTNPFCILIDTFDELERDTIELSSKLCAARIKAVGPLFTASDSAIRGDKLKANSDCLQWLDSKPQASVVYISFGSSAHLKQEQIDEIAHGVLNVGAPFLWVMMPPDPDRELTPHSLPGGFLDTAGDNGRVVEFSPQDRVLAHPSVSCFVTHCGWNSTVEALTSGIPVVAFPQWGDQLTDAKYLVDVFGVGVRMGRGEHENKVVPREEVERCIRDVMVGPKADGMRRKAMTWKDKAEKASHGGSSNTNLGDFVEDIRRRSRNVRGGSV